MDLCSLGVKRLLLSQDNYSFYYDDVLVLFPL